MEKTKGKVLLGLSGGVDSSVAALLLKKQGYEVTGAFMKCFSNSKILQGDCNSTIDRKEAQKIAAILNIPLVTLDYQKEYNDLVINPMFESYKKGLTPNPDSLCNKIIKFPLLWKEAKKRNIDFIATGHYIKKIKTKSGYKLKIPKDKTKDQSYFLYDLTQKDLKHTLFPIGDASLIKEEVRKIAKESNFPNAEKHGTRGLCFIGKIDMKSFLKQKIKPKPGKVLDEKGNIVGKHEGIMYYTIGERVKAGIEISNEFHNEMKSRLYIADKNYRKNTITVAPENSKALKKDKFRIIKTNWINGKPKTKDVKVRIRHLGELIPAKIGNDKIKLKKPIKGLAEGQSAVIYKNAEVLGGGEIRYA